MPCPSGSWGSVGGMLSCSNRWGIGTVVTLSNQIDRSIGFRLRNKRTSSGWSEEQLAEKLQIDPKDISAYEAGAKRISAERLFRLSKVLGVRPGYFFGLHGQGRPLPQEGSNFTLPDQGLRLHRAFAGIKDPSLREAIVSLAIELGKEQ
jgi:transcriptional regulator with XRE-family HTH domain